MARKRHTEEQIIRVLKEAEAGMRHQTYAGSTVSVMQHFTSGGADLGTWMLVKPDDYGIWKMKIGD